MLAVDDERPALDDLVRLLRGSARTGVVEGVGGARDALLAVGTRDWDALFLDVRMPGLDGLQLARVLTRLARPPAIVFVSAYETAAVEAFELRALDYVMKPAGRARVEEALARVEAARRPVAASAAAAAAGAPAPKPPAPEDDELVAVDQLRGGGTRLLPRGSILYLQAHGDYVRIVADDGRFLLRARLADLEERWSGAGFVRVHRGYVANLRRATAVRPLLNGTAMLRFGTDVEIPVSRRQIGDLRRRLAV